MATFIRLLLACFVLSSLTLASQEAQKSAPDPRLREESGPPWIELARDGHANVSAKQRVLRWRFTNPDAAGVFEVRFVKIDLPSMEPKEIARSAEPEGTIDVEKEGSGPGMYALLVVPRGKDPKQAVTGLRFVYTALRNDCPDSKAWRPPQPPSAKTTAPAERQQRPTLVDLARRSHAIVIATAERFQACQAAEGRIFTYVWFTGVETLEREKSAPSPLPRELILRVPGGAIDGMVEDVSDAPIFLAGDRVLLFLTRDPQQEVPIVDRAGGVLFLDPRQGTIRVYSGAAVASVEKDYSIMTDPGYTPGEKDFRSWDPNATAQWVAPAQGPPLGQPPPRPAAAVPMKYEAFRETLRAVWREADRLGRLPATPAAAPGRPGELPARSQMKSGGVK